VEELYRLLKLKRVEFVYQEEVHFDELPKIKEPFDEQLKKAKEFIDTSTNEMSSKAETEIKKIQENVAKISSNLFGSVCSDV
jgi:hypothetical protein